MGQRLAREYEFDLLDRSRAAGFCEHLTKPVDFAALQQAIARLAASMPQAGKTP